LNQKRKSIQELETAYDVVIEIVPNITTIATECTITIKEYKAKEQTKDKKTPNNGKGQQNASNNALESKKEMLVNEEIEGAKASQNENINTFDSNKKHHESRKKLVNKEEPIEVINEESKIDAQQQSVEHGIKRRTKKRKKQTGKEASMNQQESATSTLRSEMSKENTHVDKIPPRQKKRLEGWIKKIFVD
jgi:hypothetical protein